MIRLFNFARTQERRKRGCFGVLEMRRKRVYIVVVEKI